MDKFLKVSRLVKRRTVAAELCRASRIKVNGRDAKPSCRIGVGDILEIGFGSKRLSVRVIDVREHVSVAAAQELYEVISEGPV